MKELKALYLTKLEMLWDIEDQLIIAIPELIDMATDPDLKMGLREHLAETKEHRDRINTIFTNIDHKTSGQKEASFTLMLEESKKEIKAITDPAVRDAAIIASASVVEHLEMSKYKSLIEWAKRLEDKDSEELLRKTHGEEEHADKKLNEVAKGNVFVAGVVEEAVASDKVAA